MGASQCGVLCLFFYSDCGGMKYTGTYTYVDHKSKTFSFFIVERYVDMYISLSHAFVPEICRGSV